MFKKFVVYLSLILLAQVNLSAQLDKDSLNFFVTGSVGYGWYDMHELRELNTMIHLNSSYNTKITSQMPSYFTYNFELNYKLKSYWLGVGVGKASTGSRIVASDNTGYYHYDMKISSVKYGIIGGRRLYASGNYMTGDIMLLTGVLYSKLKIDQTVDVYAYSSYENKESFNAVNFYIEPKVRLNFLSFKNLSLGMELGYLYQFGGGELKGKDSDGYEENLGCQPQWDGLRIGLIISVGTKGNFKSTRQ